MVEFALEAVSRRCEVVRLGHQHVKNGRIKIERAKGSKDVDIKLTPELKAAIEAMPKGQMVYAVNSYGKRWSIDGLGNEIRQVGDQGGTAEELPNQWPEERRLAPTGRVQRNRARTAASIGASDRSFRSTRRRSTARKIADGAIEKRIKNDELANLVTPDLQTRAQTVKQR